MMILLLLYPILIMLWLFVDIMISDIFDDRYVPLKNINSYVNVDQVQIKQTHRDLLVQLNTLNGTISSLNNTVTNLLIDIDTLKSKIAHVTSTS